MHTANAPYILHLKNTKYYERLHYIRVAFALLCCTIKPLVRLGRHADLLINNRNIQTLFCYTDDNCDSGSTSKADCSALAGTNPFLSEARLLLQGML